MKTLKSLLLIILLLFTTNLAFALDSIPQDSGVSGFVRAGGGVLRLKSNMVSGNDLMDVGQDTIDSLIDEPDSETTGMAVFNFEVAYTFASTRTQLSFGSQLEDIAQLDTSQQLAVKQELPDKSIISIGFLLTGIPTEVWTDPYVTNTPRQKTDRDSIGGRFVYDRILGSAFEFNYSYRSVDLDEEQSGLALGLSPVQRDLLRRDGENHKMELSYRFDVNDRHRLLPSVSYYIQDRDGDALSNWGTDFQLTYFFFNDPVTLVLNGLIGMSDYDERNPIYGKTQENDRFAAGVQVYYKNPFGWEPFGQEGFSVFAAASYLLEDANIDFYTTEVGTITVGVLFRF